jgi:poly-gamma-glutamate system protein
VAPMKKWYRTTMKMPYLMAMTGLSILALIGVEQGSTRTKTKFYREKLLAAQLMSEGMNAIREARRERNLFLDENDDPNLTGLIGSRYTHLTTTLGSLQAKRTATNPNFAAVLVDMLVEAGVGRGDIVAAGFSGSFPSLNLATLAATTAVGAQLIAISSVGASTWGATDPMMTWLDMEMAVVNGTSLSSRSVAASVGGAKDRGESFFFDGKDLALQAIQRNTLPLIFEDTLARSVQKRLELYRSEAGERDITVFINVGGAEANVGNCPHSWKIPQGLVRSLPTCLHQNKGVAFYLAEKGAIVINFLDIRDIATSYQLPIDPIPLPQPGEGAIFYNRRRLWIVPFIALIALSVGVIVCVKKGRR